MTSYSQNKEQDVILEYFHDFKGCFIDIGANDGSTFSNTRALAELGWDGVLVEPSPKAFKKLKKLYQTIPGEFYLFDVALGTSDGKVTFYESGNLVGPDDVALVSSLLETETKRFDKVTSYSKIEVKCFTWNTFVKRLQIPHFDFISIDIEGLEIDVLRQIDLSKTKMVCIETNGDMLKKLELTKILPDFKIIYTSGENLIFAR